MFKRPRNYATKLFLGMQAQPSCPNAMETSTSSKQTTLKTPGKCFTRSKVKKMEVYGIWSGAFCY